MGRDAPRGSDVRLRAALRRFQQTGDPATPPSSRLSSFVRRVLRSRNPQALPSA